MSHGLTVYRFVAFVLAMALLVSVSPQLAGADDLSRGRARAAIFVAIGSESDALDGHRFARRVYSSFPYTDMGSAAFTPVFSWFQGETYAPALPRKLFRLNLALLI
jgi:hypothetical protein